MKDNIRETFVAAMGLILSLVGVAALTISIVAPIVCMINGTTTATLWWCLPSGIASALMFGVGYCILHVY